MVAYFHFHPGRLDKNLCAPASGSLSPITQRLGPWVNQYTDSGFLLLFPKSHLRGFFFRTTSSRSESKGYIIVCTSVMLGGSCSTMALLMEWIVLLHPVRFYVELLSQYVGKWPYLGIGPLERSLWPNGDIWVVSNSMTSTSTEEKRSWGFAWQRKRRSKVAICMLWKGALERLTLSAPWSWTLSFLYHKKTDFGGAASSHCSVMALAD